MGTKMAKTKLENGDEKPTKMAKIKLENGDEKPTQMVKIKLESGDEKPTQIVKVKLENGDEKPTKMAKIKPENGDEKPTKMAKIKLENGDEKPTQMAKIKLENVDEKPTQMVQVKLESIDDEPYDSTSDAGDRNLCTCEDGPNSKARLSTMAKVRSLQQENNFLKSEVDTLKSQRNHIFSECKNLKEEMKNLNEELRGKMVKIKQSGAEKPMRASDFTFTNVKLSPELAALLGENTMPRTQVLKKMWAIFKERGLQDPADKRYIRIVDEDLKKVFTKVEGGRLMKGLELMKHLKAHMITM